MKDKNSEAKGMEAKSTKETKDVSITGSENQAGSRALSTRSDPLNLMLRFDELDRAFDRMFNNLSTRGWLSPFSEMTSFSRVRAPAVDVIEQDDQVTLFAELPGATKDNIDISVSGNSITIRGGRQWPAEQEGTYYLHEISKNEFSRTLTLPCMVESEKISAKLENGLLELSLPKQEKEKRHHISIS